MKKGACQEGFKGARDVSEIDWLLRREVADGPGFSVPDHVMLRIGVDTASGRMARTAGRRRLGPTAGRVSVAPPLAGRLPSFPV